MKFAALIATAAALKTPHLPKASMAQKFGRKGLSLAQAKSAVGQEDDYTVEEVFNWFDRDGSGAIDIYEFIFGIGWICGYYVYEPTDEDLEMLEAFWWDCDSDMNGELSLEEVEAYAHNNGW
jgi:hypothetical protein